jgi:hypothetical protein
VVLGVALSERHNVLMGAELQIAASPKAFEKDVYSYDAQ